MTQATAQDPRVWGINDGMGAFRELSRPGDGAPAMSERRRVVEFLWEGGGVKGRDQFRWTAPAREAPHIPITANPAAAAKQMR